jgi:hypothetical protein
MTSNFEATILAVIEIWGKSTLYSHCKHIPEVSHQHWTTRNWQFPRFNYCLDNNEMNLDKYFKNVETSVRVCAFVIHYTPFIASFLKYFTFGRSKLCTHRYTCTTIMLPVHVHVFLSQKCCVPVISFIFTGLSIAWFSRYLRMWKDLECSKKNRVLHAIFRCESIIWVFILCLIMHFWSIIQLKLRIQAYVIKSCFERLRIILPKLRPSSNTVSPN